MGTEQQFCLRWNNHQSTLISVFDSLLENSVLVDCTLAADGQQLKAHKVVLSACSPYLETILSQHHDKHPIIILKDVKFAELRAMLEYMYRGEVNISQEQLGNFLKAAETLQIKGLTDSGGRGVTGGASNGGDYNNKYKTQGLSQGQSVLQTDYIPVDHRSRTGGLIPDDRKQGLVIPSHVVTDRAPQSPLAAREGSVSPTLRKRRKMNNYEPTNLRTTFPSSDTPDTTSAFPESLPPHTASQGSPSPPLSESASSAAAVPCGREGPADYARQPSAVVKTELCNDTTSENEDSVTGDDRSINAGDDERSNAAAVPAAGPSRHFISHGFGDKQHTLQDGSNDEFSHEDLQNSTQDVKLGHTIVAPRRAPPSLYAVHATNVIDKDKDKELAAQSFPCDRCGKVYNRKGNLGRHVRYECGKGPQFPCHLCEKRFFRREKLAQHVRNHDIFQAAALPLVWGQGRVSI